jgi:endonuclease/exonuclease/phosphatase family metal-dependent hydrolase
VLLSRTLLCFLLLVSFRGSLVTTLLVAPLSAQEVVSRRLCVLSYNIHHGEGVDGRVDLPRLAKIIRAANPDLVAIQEVDKATRRTGMTDQTKVLIEATGMHGAFAKQIDYDGGEYGQAVLSKFPITSLEVHWLPGQPDRERRIVGVATLQFNGQPLLFATTHLHHARADLRLRQAMELNRLLAHESRLVILAGDLNATPNEEPIAILTEKWRVVTGSKLLTFPATTPDRQLDYVALHPVDAWEIVRAEVIDEAIASDHRPLLATVELLSP